MISRRTFAIVVRVLAVLAAIYTFFTFRSQFAEQQPSRGAIPVKVVRETACGWLTLTESSSVANKVNESRGVIHTALQNPGERVAVLDKEECDRLAKLNDSIISTEKGQFKIHFSKAP